VNDCKHTKAPQKNDFWRIKSSQPLRRRQLSGQVIQISSVHHCNDPRRCYVIGNVGKREGVTVRLVHLSERTWAQYALPFTQ